MLRQHVEEKKNLGSILNVLAAEAAGAHVTWYGRKTAVATLDGRQVLLGGYVCDQSWVGSKIAADKWMTKEFLLRSGVATPAARRCSSVEEAVEFWRTAGRSVVIKPLGGMGGKGVSVNLRDEHEISAAFERALRIDDGGVIVEEYIEGDREYRVLATQERCVSVVQRLLPNVTGDGVSTIRELIEAKNTARRRNPALINRYTPIDVITERFLAFKGLSLDSVLESGRQEVVRDVGGLSSGGEPVERLDEVEEAIRSTAVAASAAVPGLTWSGSDILVEKGTGKPWVIEINSTPDILGSTYPLYGQPRDVAGETWRLRWAAAPPVVTGAADVPPRGTTGSELAAVVGGAPDARRWTRLSTVMQTVLRDMGYAVRRHSDDIVSVEDDDGSQAWFTRNFLGVRDKIAPRQLVGRSGTTRRLVGAADLPRVTGRLVYSTDQAAQFMEEHHGACVIVPQLKEWASSSSSVTVRGIDELEEGLASIPGPWLIQRAVASSRRVTVITTPRRVLWMCGAPGTHDDLPPEMIGRIAEVAVGACRAVPELRWVGVDINVRLDGRAQGEDPSVLVEGLTFNPRLRRDAITMVGSLNHVISKVIRS
ncbi:ATP-grasp domain-containing protein [Nesterenkonia sp. CL21]|uniref:ATP-grasp domain-containing protein n=1 Tax=Nesterenkonia sp. CL21 TaxID=3064894 RepID=UPI002879C24F|nr:ATP-grasp domain-containing protein [Nesterenkonia sp. CL21]MDS2174060.1 ATP-grasp domain-containing protein [Nesterenkonia sp. CL21]